MCATYTASISLQIKFRLPSVLSRTEDGVRSGERFAMDTQMIVVRHRRGLPRGEFTLVIRRGMRRRNGRGKKECVRREEGGRGYSE